MPQRKDAPAPAQEVRLSVRGLVEFVWRCGDIDSRFSGFDRANEGSRIHRKLQKSAGEGYKAEVVMRAVRTVDGIAYRLEGRADGVIEEADGFVIDEIKTTAAPAELLTEDFNPLHWAQAKCYGAFLCADTGLEAVTVQLTYYQVETEQIIRHRRRFAAGELEAFLQETLRLYAPWAQLSEDWLAQRTDSLKRLTFPFETYRPGQYALAGAVYKTVAAGGRLFAMAPTGIGKTISTLFPACKAMGEGKGQRIFYLTAKTITRTAAEDALRLMRNTMREKTGECLRLKAVTLTAKDKICPMERRECTPEACPRAKGYYDRINNALYRLISEEDVFTRQRLQDYAREQNLCPFELTLDVSNWCDCIIGDYNYLFDPVVNLKRYFEDGGDFIFLVDEAHNLLDRAREMYSARLQKSAFLSAKRALGKTARRLTQAISKVNNAFVVLRKGCEEAEGRQMLQAEGPEDLVKALLPVCRQMEEWLEENREGALHDELLQLYFEVRFFLRIWELYDDHFTTLIRSFGRDVTVDLLCLDPADFLDGSMSLGRASVLFSATLSPLPYFIRTLGGGEEAHRLCLASPFPRENLCLLEAPYLSTKYADRAATLDDICDLIAAAVSGRKGNYLAFFPSYQYLKMAAECFARRYPDVSLAIQESGMAEDAREAFLARFSEENRQTLLGMCVLGGVFAEGIDLAGNRLIGSIIVGVGLPQVNAVQDALRDYYQQHLGAGFDYAYRYPGMNKVLQAAGRVIRTGKDRGMVLLIDSRYGQYAYRQLFPAHWLHCRTVHSAEEAARELAAFWMQADASENSR